MKASLQTKELFLGVDIGGTRTRIGLVALENGRLRLLESKEILTKTVTASSFATALVDAANAAKKKYGVRPSKAAIACAGPISVKGGRHRVELTNAPLTLDEETLLSKTRFERVLLLNDFEALAWSVDALEPKKLKVIRRGVPAPGSRLLIGPGTGLGISILVQDPTGVWRPVASEGAHTPFPLETVEDFGLAAFITETERRNSFISYEDILSGKGVERIYNHLRLTKCKRPEFPPTLTAAEIFKTRTTNRCSAMTIELFLDVLGRAARNMTLQACAWNGVTLGGGVVIKNKEVVGKRFVDAFSRYPNPRFARLLEKVPLQLLTDEHAAIVGGAAALVHARERE